MLTKTRRTAFALAGATATFASIVTANPVQAQPQTDDVGTAATTREKIVQFAHDELNNKSRNREIPMGSDCNYYSGFFGKGSACSQSGFRSQAWCADFAKYVWKNAGVRDTDQLNSLALSFRSYGVNHGTWYNGTDYIRPGDAAVYSDGGGKGHVGIVVAVDYERPANSLVISGNYGNKIDKHKLSDRSNYIGFAKPVG